MNFEYEEELPASRADLIHAATALIAQLQEDKEKGELFDVGIRILDYVAAAIQPDKQAAKLSAISGGKK